MSDLQHYITERKKKDPKFAANYDVGYSEFKIGEMVRELRQKAGLTQADLAHKLHTKKSAVSRLEQHATDIRLSTLLKIALLFGKRLRISFQ